VRSDEASEPHGRGERELDDFLPTTRFQPTLVFSPAATELLFSSNQSGQFNAWRRPCRARR
jgi:hypothetical protein